MDSQTGAEREEVRERNAGSWLAFFVPFFSQSRTLTHGMVLPTFMVGLSLIKFDKAHTDISRKHVSKSNQVDSEDQPSQFLFNMLKS